MDLWLRVQQRLGTGRKSRATKKETLGLFTGIIHCADCGGALSFQRRQYKGKELGFYRCSRYTNSSACTPHNVQEDTIAEVVLNDVRRYAVFAVSEREQLIQRLLADMTQNHSSDVEELQAKYREIDRRSQEITSRMISLYEDKCNGVITEGEFSRLKAGYSDELDGLTAKMPELRRQIDAQETTAQEISDWTDRISRLVNLETLDRATAMELIESINVSEGEKIGTKRQIGITIKYRFVGCIGGNPAEPLSDDEDFQKKREDIA